MASNHIIEATGLYKTFGSVMGMAAIGTGSMAGASASLGAFVLYCAMRDGMQQFVKLNPKDRDGPESRDPTVKDSALSGGAYTVDEFGVGMGMSYTSSPSGAGAAGEVLQTAHGAERAGWNTAGEVFDDWVSNAIKKGGIPDLRAGIEMPTLEGFKDTLTGAFPARATLFTATTLLSQIIADKSTHASPATQTAVNNLGVAMLLGLMYVPFAQMGNIRKPAPGETARGPILPTTATTTATDNGGALTRRNARRHRHHQGTRSVPVSPSGIHLSASVVRGDVRVHPTPPSVGEAKIDIHPADTLLAQMLRQQARFHSTRSRP